MTIRSRDLVLAVGTLAFAGACWIALIAVDATRAAANPETMRVLHTVIVGALITLTVVAAIWIAGVIVCREVRRDHGRQDRHLAAITNGQVEANVRLEEITGEIPKIQPIVVRAADPRTDQQLDDYARGYVAGLARAPMENPTSSDYTRGYVAGFARDPMENTTSSGNGKVVPINGRTTP